MTKSALRKLEPYENSRLAEFMEWKARGPLYAYRKRSYLTMGALATVLGVSIGTVQNLEDGNRSPIGKPYYAALSSLLKCPPDELSRRWRSWIQHKPAI